MKAYGIDLMVNVNFKKLMTEKMADKLQKLSGFIALAPYADGQTMAALFRTPEERGKAYTELSKEIKCAVIMETAEI